MTLADKISSMRGQLSVPYTKADIEKNNRFIEDLKVTQSALDYLTITRNLTHETITNFKLGYDKEKDAISIPVYKNGELVNIRYRYIDPEKKPKYTQEKGCEVWLYNEDGIELAKTKGGVLIVEGEFDLMSAWQAGFKNVISPASGKDSYGVWVSLLDSIPKIYIAYDNDKPGKKAGIEFSERLGVNKTFEVIYPEGIKDANDFFKIETPERYRQLIKDAKPYYKYRYQGLDNVIEMIKIKGEQRLELKCLPDVKLHEDWLVVVSGMSGIGKTTYALNIADELVNRGIPTLVFPFERGIKDVGQRYLQINLSKTEDEILTMDEASWDKVIPDVVDIPLYFSKPHKEEFKTVIEDAKKMFGVKVVIIDHLDWFIGSELKTNQANEMQQILQGWKDVCIENNIIFIVVHHIRKGQNGAVSTRKPTMEDLKGGSASYQVAEVVVMLSSEDQTQIEVTIEKNKGPEKHSKVYSFNKGTGAIGKDITNDVQSKKQQELPNGQDWFNSLTDKK